MNSSKRVMTSATSKKNEQRRTYIWLLAVVILLSAGSVWYFLAGPGSSKSQALDSSIAGIKAQTATVTRGDITLSAFGSGTLVAGREIDLSFSASGTVVELNVKLGDQVETGDILARMGNSVALEADQAAAELQLLEARQALQKLQENSDLALAQAYQDYVTAQVKYDDTLKASQRTGYARCSQEVRTRYKAILDHATEKLKELTENEKGSDAWIDAKNDYDTAYANFSYCDSYTSDEKLSARSELGVAQAALIEAEEIYSSLKAGSGIDPVDLERLEAEIKDAETQLNKIKDDLDGLVLTAPISGTVIYLAADEGEIMDTSLFITIADVANPSIEIFVDETDLDKMIIGSPVTITFDAVDNQVFSGSLSQVDPEMVTSGQYNVIQGIVKLDENSARTVQNFLLGMNASVTVLSQQSTETLLIPLTALQKLENGEYAVNIVDGSGTFTERTVTVGLMDSSQAEITSGLNEGDIVSTQLTKYSMAGTGSPESLSPEGVDFPGGGEMPPGGGMLMP